MRRMPAGAFVAFELVELKNINSNDSRKEKRMQLLKSMFPPLKRDCREGEIINTIINSILYGYDNRPGHVVFPEKTVSKKIQRDRP